VCFGQNAQVSGSIRDPSSLTVSGADVSILNDQTGGRRNTRSNTSGFYSLPSLAPGNYRITIRATGFETIVREGIKLEVGDNARLDFDLRIGDSRTVVTVHGGPPLINTEDASVGTVIDRDIIDQMPLNGRGIQTLIELSPGVVATPVVGMQASGNSRSTVSATIPATLLLTGSVRISRHWDLTSKLLPAECPNRKPCDSRQQLSRNLQQPGIAGRAAGVPDTNFDLCARVRPFPGGADRNDHAIGDKPLHRLPVRISSQRQDGRERLVRERVRNGETAAALQ
jgi:hypothetical protein